MQKLYRLFWGCGMFCLYPIYHPVHNNVMWRIELNLFNENVIPFSQLTEIQQYIIQSCLARNDKESALQYIKDWKESYKLKGSFIYKWIPGSHYYCLDKKFNTIEEAKKHLEDNFILFYGLQYKYIYNSQGA